MPASTTPSVTPDAHIATAQGILRHLTAGYPRRVAVRFWDGSTWESEGEGPAEFTVLARHPGSIRLMFWPFNRVALGEAYIYDDFDIEGDFFRFIDWLEHIIQWNERTPITQRLKVLPGLLRLPRQANPREAHRAGQPIEGDHTLQKDKEAISFAYNVPGEFYELFLGHTMQYTCAYYRDFQQNLDDAQTDKMDLICKKLRLQPGERFLDIGCGWGNLLIHAARHYGVHATGVTLAGEQAKWCERAIQESGLQDRIKILIRDYREIDGTYDKVASVGMSEHVGPKNLPVLFQTIWNVLRPGGAYLHHCITLRPHTPYPRWTAFARKYVFPNGELHTVVDAVNASTAVGFDVRDVENLREHYVQTLIDWVRRLENRHDRAVELLGEVGYRVFRLYMAGATMGFRRGIYNLNQCLLAKPDQGNVSLPLRRTDWYC